MAIQDESAEPERPPDIVCSGGFRLPPIRLIFGQQQNPEGAGDGQ